MDNKKVASVRTITGELIGGFILYGIPFSILYMVIRNWISNIISSESLIISVMISIVLQGVVAYCIWKCSITTTFKKRAINKNDVSTVIKNLVIFTFILCLFSAIMNFSEVNRKLDRNTNEILQFSEIYRNNEKQKNQYLEKKEKSIAQTKNKLYTYLLILEVGLLIVYLGVAFLQKKSILKYSV